MGRTAILLMTLLALSGSAADKAAAEVVAESAEWQMVVARYYIRQRNYTAAMNRFRIVLTKFESSEYVAESLAGATEVYLALGLASEASAAAAALECKFPNGEWTAKAKALLKSAGLAPAESPASWFSRFCR